MKIKIIQGDITIQPVEAIVNAANNGLYGGAGVDGAIHRAAGPRLSEYCRLIREKQGGCKTGDAVITPPGNIGVKYIIHAVGPVWSGGNRSEVELLKSAYNNSLSLAGQYELRSIAFPNISTGVYGFPKQLAAESVAELIDSYKKNPNSVESIFFVCYDQENYDIYKKIIYTET